MSMVLNVVPSPHQQLESLQRELFARNRQLNEAETRIADLEAELVRERAKAKQVERGAQRLRDVLSPLHDAIGMVFGEIEAMGIESPTQAPATASGGVDPRKAAVWEDWKSRLGGFAAKAIDALLLHGELSTDQMMIHLRTSRRQTVHDTVSKMNKAGIIAKRDGKVSLKAL